ncbi:hypothetical protein [Phytohabitans rumicis]|uniref:Uncharacterized protein n=1 Tax=Phytohabitans rumicis TaxID=1076125 RepID=A0A6V8KMM7_9ACTN|nr:hypothetical protein [Phytohabitans rumicis]GFJ86413.1 hypothetical protein Prum_000550 [Phytohabitans rumicis]
MSVEMPRAASSWHQPEVYMCSLVLSNPFHMIMQGACGLADVKYAGSAEPSNGTSTRVVRGSDSSKERSIRSRQCR